ncbi:CHASE2 domain-containing protein [Pantanalinema rosaneae CENA516]|uniref:CHASE2 domain-containing protein n=1 Tax=Pantanalinema rosaneae TaxID=1620701 RepID=UPI003D6EC2DD
MSAVHITVDTTRMWAKQLRQRLWQGRGIWITAPTMTLAVVALRFTGALQLLEWATLDQFFRWRSAEPADPRIVLVTIDETDIAQQGWPITDARLAQALTTLKQQQPRAIGIDLYRELPIAPGREQLIQVFESTPNLIGIGKIVSNPLGSAVQPPPTLDKLGQVGASDLVIDGDGKIRRILLSLKDSQNRTISALGTKLAIMYLQAEGIEAKVLDSDPSKLQLGKAIFTPMQEQEGGYANIEVGGYQILANFRHPIHPFPSISFTDVVNGKIPRDLLRDKVVLLGATAESLGDYFYTSYSTDLIDRSAGVSIHANVVSQIISAALDGRPLLWSWSETAEWLWILGWALVGARLGWTLKPPRWTIVNLLLANAAVGVSAYLLFLQGGWIIVVPPMLAMIGATVVNKAYILWETLNASYRSLEEYSRTLEHRVEVRTLELSQKNSQLSQEIQERQRAEAALRQSELQLRNQNTVLMSLSRNKALYRGDLTIALREITHAAAYTLGIERASIWLYDEMKTQLRCHDLFESSRDRHSKGMTLTATDYPTYFQALAEDWIICADDAQTNPKTREFYHAYLSPLGVTSLLDISIQLGGQIMGILCLEQIGEPRQWTIEEQNFAGSLADLTSLAIEAQARLRAEKALQDAEEKYRSIFENAVEGIFQTTFDGHYLSANPALARIYGFDSPLDLFNNLHNIAQQLYVEPQRRAEFIQLIQAQGEVAAFESQVYRKDGSVIWISENARAVRDERGRLLYYEGIVQDITARKQVEIALRAEQAKSERLLLNILPGAIADRLKQSEDLIEQPAHSKALIADSFESVTVLFADIVNFTTLSANISPADLVGLLNRIFLMFDDLCDKHGLEKIKTIGDAYMVVGGLPQPRSDHAQAIAEMALDMQAEMQQFSTYEGDPIAVRVGINTGAVVAGVIGKKKFIYDLWGDAVNMASRMESHGIAGGIQVTESTYGLLKDQYRFEPRGSIQVKGRGQMQTYFLLDRQ